MARVGLATTRFLTSTAILLTMAVAASRAHAQLVYDPNAGFLAPSELQGRLPLPTTDTLPLFPTTGLGFAGAPAIYTGTTRPAALPPPRVIVGQNPLLPPIQSGAAPIQTGDDRAPWFLAFPSLDIATGFDDNPRQTPNRFADSVSSIKPSLVGSIDTPHVQAFMSGSAQYLKYARATDQDLLTLNGAGYGLITVAPEHFYIDGRAAMFQVSPTGGIGFTNSALIGPTQELTLLTTSVTPILRQSFSDDVQADLRYNHSTVTPNNALVQSNALAPATPIAAAEANQGFLTVAFGHGEGALSSRLSLSAADIELQSTPAATRVSGFDEVQYRINRAFALTARGGYENLRYPQVGQVFVGPIATIGARIDMSPDSGLIVRYGREDGGWGLNGSYRQNLTPRTVMLASYQHGISSQQEQIFTNLNQSSLDPYGTIVSTDTGLPLALANPELNFTNQVSRTQRASLALVHEFETDSVRLFGFFEKDSSLIPGTSGDIGRGAEISWFRSMTPQLSSAVSVGYATHTGSKTLSAAASLSYTINERLSATLNYQLQDVFLSAASGGGPSTLRNIVMAGLRVGF